MTHTNNTVHESIRPIQFLFDKKELLNETRELYQRNYALKKQVKFMDARLGALIQFYKENTYSKINQRKHSKESRALATLNDDLNQQIMNDHMKQVYGSLVSNLQIQPCLFVYFLKNLTLNDKKRLCELIVGVIYGDSTRDDYLLLCFIFMVICTDCEGSLNMNQLLLGESTCSSALDAYFTRDAIQDYIFILLKTVFDKDSFQSSGKDDVDSQATFSTNSKTEYYLDLDDYTLGNTFKFLNAILSTVELIPYGVAWILKQVNFLFKRNDSFMEYNGAERNVCRFYFGCIAKGMRHPYQLMEWDTKIQQDIIQVSKALEYISQPEAFQMNKELDVWMEKHQRACHEFIVKAYSVSDFYKDLQIHQMVSLTIDEEIDLSISDLWFLHSLVSDFYQPSMESDDSDHSFISKFLGEVRSSPHMARIPGKIVHVPLFHRWNHGFLPSQPSFLFQDVFNAKEVLYMDVKSSLLELFSCIESNKHDLIYNWKVDQAIESALKSSFTLLSQIGSLNRSLLNDLSRFSELDIYKPHSVLHQEVVMELKIQGNYKIKLQTETEQLTFNKNLIQEHYTFLQKQLEAFQVALINIRNRFPFSKKKISYSIPKALKEELVTSLIKEKEGLQDDSKYDSMLILISSPSAGCIQVILTDKNYGEPQMEWNFTLDDLLEKKMYGVYHLMIESISISIDALLSRVMNL